MAFGAVPDPALVPPGSPRATRRWSCAWWPSAPRLAVFVVILAGAAQPQRHATKRSAARRRRCAWCSTTRGASSRGQPMIPDARARPRSRPRALIQPAPRRSSVTIGSARRGGMGMSIRGAQHADTRSEAQSNLLLQTAARSPIPPPCKRFCARPKLALSRARPTWSKIYELCRLTTALPFTRHGKIGRPDLGWHPAPQAPAPASPAGRSGAP